VAGRFGHLRVPEAFDAYLRRTIVNLCNSHFRHQRVVRAALEREAAEASDRTVDEPDLGLREELRVALHQLPVRQRTAVATDAALARLDGDGWQVFPLPPAAPYAEIPDADEMAVGDDGRVWFVATDQNWNEILYSFDGTSLTANRVGDDVWAIEPAPDGVIWVGVDDTLMRYART
jgi:streptogramin lyase